MKRSTTALKNALHFWRRWREPGRKGARRKEVEGVAEGSEERFRSLVQNASDVILIMGADQTVRYVSPAVQSVLGYKAEDLIGKDNLAPVHPDDLARVQRAIDAAVSNPGTPSYMELRLGHADGSWRYMESVCTSLLGDPAVDGIVFNSRDVTERKRVEEDLKESEARYRTLVEQTPAITYIEALDAEEVEHEILYVSPQIEELLGYSREEWTSNPNLWEELLHPDDRERVLTEDARTERTGEPFSVEYRIIARDGRTVYIRDDAVLVWDDSGQPRFWQGVTYDITDRKEAEARLREAEEKYRTVVERVPAVIYTQEAANSNAVTYVSPQLETMLGYDLEEWTSDPEYWVKTLHPADRKRVLAKNRHTNETGEPFKMEYRRLAKDGRVVWIRDEATLVRDKQGEPGYWLGVQVDVTERKRAEEALEESELRLRTVTTNVPVVLFALDYAGVFKLSEGKGLDVLGLEPGEAVGRSVSEIHGDEPEILEDVDRALAGEEFRAVREIGSRRFEMWYSPLRTITDEVMSVIGVAVDVTDREQALEALRQSEERFRKLADAAFEGIVIHDGGRVLEANEAYAAMHGYELSEMVGRSGLEWVAPEYRDLVRQNILSGYEAPYESVEMRKDGTRIDVEVRGRTLSYQGRTVRVTAVRDVTKRKEAEARLREAEEKYRLLVEQIPAVTYINRADGSDTPLYTSPQIETMLGYTSEEWTENRLWPKRLHPDDRERVLAADERFEAGGEAFDEEYRLIHKDGSVVWVHEEAVLLRGEAGEPLYWQGILTDITGRKRAEEAVRESEVRFRAIFENAALGISIADLDRRLVETNSAYQDMLGYSREELLGKPIAEISHPDDVPADTELNRKLLEGELDRYQLEKRYIRKDGELVWVRPTISIVRDAEGDPQFLVGMVEDITEHKRAEDLLRQQSAAMAASMDGVAILDENGTYIYMNRAHAGIYGYDDPEELLGRSWEVLYGEKELERLERNILPALWENGRWSGEALGKKRDGSTFPQEVSLTVIERSGIVCVVRDASERKRAEEALRESEEKYRAVMEQTIEGIYLGDAETKRVLESNSTFQEMLGYTAEELDGMHIYDFIAHDPENIDAVFQSILDVGHCFIGERRYRRKDGSVLHVETSATVITFRDREVLCTVLRDVTERKRTEERLRQQAALLDLSYEPILAWELDGGITYWNRGCEELYGFSREEALGHVSHRLLQTVHPMPLERFEAVLEREEQWVGELTQTARDGRRITVESRHMLVRVADGRQLVLETNRDITERKRVEDALRESEERYRLVARATNEVIWDNDLTTGKQTWDGALQAMFGYALEEVGGEAQWWEERIHPEDRTRVLSSIDALLESGGEMWTAEYRFRRRDGEYATVVDRGYVVRDGMGEPVRMLGSMMDITGRKRTEDALRESEERHRRQARELDLLHQVRTALAQELELPTVFRTVVEAIARTYGYTQVSAYLLRGETLVLQHQVGYERVIERIPVTEGVSGRTVRTGRPALVEEVRADRDFLGAIENITSEICVPLFDENEVAGTLNVESTNGVELTEDDLRLMTALAEHVNVAISRARLYTRVRDSEAWFRSLIRNASDVIALLDPDSTVRYMSPAVERVTGYRPEDLFGEDVFGYVHPDDLKWVSDSFAESVADPDSHPTTWYRFRHKDGSWRHLESIFANLLDDPGVGAIVVNTRDVTERKRAEEIQDKLAHQAELRADVSAALAEGGALRSTLQRCAEAVVENLGAAFARVWTINEEESVLDLQASAGIYTHTDGPHGRIPLGEFKVGHIALEGRPNLTNDVANDPRISDKEWARREGMVAFAGYPLLVEDRLVGVMALFAREPLAEDTTEALAPVAEVIAQGIERKRAEEALRRSEKSLAEAQRVAQIGNWEYEVKGDRARWSGEMYRIFGLSPGEFTPTYKAFLGLVHPDDKGLVQRAVREALYDRGGRRSIEYRIVRLSGEVRCVRSEYEVLSDEEGKPKRLFGTVHDITKRKRAEERLREAEARYRTLVEQIPAVVYIQGIDEHDNAIVYISPQIEGIMGYSSQEYLEDPELWIRTTHPEDRERVLAEDARTYQTGEPFLVEFRKITRDGRVIWVRDEAVLVKDAEGHHLHWQGIFTDITERKQAEEEIKEANQRLEELAILKADFTAMVAHELDTPLAVIRGYADMMATGELGPTEQSQALDKIQGETDLLEALVSDVRTAATVEREAFAINLRPVTVGTLLRDAAAFAETLPGNHPLVVENATDGQEVWADPYRVGQVLRNLLSNAAKYSPEGAPIKLRAAPADNPECVRVEVEDRGAGIHPDDAARIFEKFGRGRDRSGRKVAGVGLGLYLVRRLLQAHGSELTLDSTSGGGSVFGFELEVIG